MKGILCKYCTAVLSRTPGQFRCPSCKQYNFPEAIGTSSKRIMKLSEARTVDADGKVQRVRRYPVGFFTQLFGRTGDQRGVAESMVVLLAGPPGAGKTTLLLMLCELLLEQITPEEGGGVWIANEMSPEELLAFAERLRLKHIERITVVNAMGGLDFDLMSTLKSLKPRFTILDSLSSLVGEGGGADEAGERIVKQFKK